MRGKSAPECTKSLISLKKSILEIRAYGVAARQASVMVQWSCWCPPSARHAPCRCAATAARTSGAQHHHGSIASDERRIGDDASSDAGGNVRGWSASSGVHRVACGVCGGFGGQRRRVNHCLRCLRHTRLPGAAVRQRRRLARQVCDRLGAVLGSVGGADGVRRPCDAEVRRMLCGALSDAQGDYQGMNHNRLPSRQSVQRFSAARRVMSRE
jgi:hypothetical protein